MKCNHYSGLLNQKHALIKTDFSCYVLEMIDTFPGHAHLQYLIACSMKVWMGKAWDIWSCMVTSDRQRVDTWTHGPDCFVLNHPWHCEQQMVFMLPCYCFGFQPSD